jgi:hypothetical protein
MAAKGLDDLLATRRGRDFLLSNGIHTEPAAFRAALSAPADQTLARACRAGDGLLVHMHQQIYLDHRPSVLGKVRVLDALGRRPDAGQERIHAACLWIDTDRAASDKLACRYYWPFQGVLRAMKITPPGSERLETRFASVDPALTDAAYQRIAGYIRQESDASEQHLARLSSLRPHMIRAEPALLHHYGLQLTRTLFRAHLGMEGTHLVVSDLLAQGLLTSAAEDVLAVLPGFIAAYNARIAVLARQGIAAAVRPIPPDYLPLHFSDPDDGSRLRLHHEIIRGDHFASATGRSGRTHRFFLGTARLRLDTLTATGRWSPDVILPMLVNALFSGWVAGKSSALYALVFNKVLAEVLGKKPVPVLVPEPPAFAAADAAQASSLLHAYVTGSALPGQPPMNQRANP